MSVGQALRQARLDRNLSIAEVATAIRIRATIVQDIEQDNFESCGGETYGRGHQRMYARFLELDIEDQIAAIAPKMTEFETSSISATTLKPIGAKPNWSVVLGAGSLVAIALLVVIVIGNNDGLSSPNTITTQPGIESNTDSTTGSVTTTAPSATETTNNGDLTAAATNNVTVGIRVVSDSCWLRVEDGSGAVVFQGVLRAGDEQNFSDSTQLSLVLGNAGGVNFTLNGNDLGTPGTLGQVLRLTLLPGQTVIAP